MFTKRLAVAAILLSAIAFVAFENTLLHTDDGCALETHCNTCLRQLASTGVIPLALPLPTVAPVPERPAPLVLVRHRAPAPRRPSSRGPPFA